MTHQITLARCAPRPRAYRSPACATCRFHAHGGACTYAATCPAPSCQWCHIRPATRALPFNGSQIEVCDGCAGHHLANPEHA